MLLARPLSLKLIFHYYNQPLFLQTQINRQRELYEWAMYLLIFFLFHFTVFVAGLFLFLVFIFFFFSSCTLHCLPLFFFSVLFAKVCSCFFFFFSCYFLGGLVFSLIVSVETLSVTISWWYVWFFGTKSIYAVFSYTCSCRNIHTYTGYIPTQW